MDNQPIRDERILHAIEACRPGSDDVADPALGPLEDKLAANPELADLYDRLQLLDAKLGATFRDVPVPEGLEQRLLDRLAAARAQQAASAPAAETAFPPDIVVSPRPKRISRRLAVVAGGSLSAAAVVLVAAWIGGVFRAEPYDGQAVLNEAIERFNERFNEESPVSMDGVPGTLLAGKALPTNWIRQVPGMRWRPIKGFLGCDGVAYDYMVRGKVQATLYVVDRQVTGLPSRPSFQPGFSTAGCSASAWIEKGLVYVLVVRGDASTYRRFIARRGPLA